MRDFLPEEVALRKHVLGAIERVFALHGFQPVETPAMEFLEVLLGKYGTEAEKLIFKVLNSGNFLEDIPTDELKPQNWQALSIRICEKGLRYDLTVPMARFVAKHQHRISFPFKRYQIQPVWRAEKPQKGRFREFVQCDADIVGTTSIYADAEVIQMAVEGLRSLGVDNFTVRVNDRKLVEQFLRELGLSGIFRQICTAIDKLDRVGVEGVRKELESMGISAERISQIVEFIHYRGNQPPEGSTLCDLFSLLKALGVSEKVVWDCSLVRGLDYYTGMVIEVGVEGFPFSVAGGGRYDELTALFGLEGVSGVGFSFGVDRLCEILSARGGELPACAPHLVAIPIDRASWEWLCPHVEKWRDKGLRVDFFYPDFGLKKALRHAHRLSAPYAVIVGSEELRHNCVTFRNMKTGEQKSIPPDSVPAHIQQYAHDR